MLVACYNISSIVNARFGAGGFKGILISGLFGGGESIGRCMEFSIMSLSSADQQRATVIFGKFEERL